MREENMVSLRHKQMIDCETCGVLRATERWRLAGWRDSLRRISHTLT